MFDYESIIETLIEWASKAWDWLKNFIPYVYDQIVSLLGVVKDWIKEALDVLADVSDKIQAVLTDPRYEKGKRIIEILRESNGSKIPDNANSVAFTMTDETVNKMASFSSNNIEEPAQFDTLMEENDGVLIIR